MSLNTFVVPASEPGPRSKNKTALDPGYRSLHSRFRDDIL